MGEKKACREPKTEAIPEETSRPTEGLESIPSSGEETDEDDEILPSASLHPRGLRTRVLR